MCIILLISLLIDLNASFYVLRKNFFFCYLRFCKLYKCKQIEKIVNFFVYKKKMSYSPSSLLLEILSSKGLSSIADEETLKNISTEEKEKIYESQKEVIALFRQKSTKEISDLQAKLSLYSPQSSPMSPASTSSENLLKTPSPDKKTPPASPKPPPLSKQRTDKMSRSMPFFDDSGLNRKNSRHIDTTPAAPKSPPVKTHYDSLDKRPRFNNY